MVCDALLATHSCLPDGETATAPGAVPAGIVVPAVRVPPVASIAYGRAPVESVAYSVVALPPTASAAGPGWLISGWNSQSEIAPVDVTLNPKIRPPLVVSPA